MGGEHWSVPQSRSARIAGHPGGRPSCDRGPELIAYELDEERSLAIVTVRGDLSDGEMVDWFGGFLAALGRLERVGGVVDTRGLAGFQVSSEAVHTLTVMAEGHDAVFADSRWAFVADQDVVFGMARMYQMLRESAPYEIGVFRSMEEALRWLEGAASPSPAEA